MGPCDPTDITQLERLLLEDQGYTHEDRARLSLHRGIGEALFRSGIVGRVLQGGFFL